MTTQKHHRTNESSGEITKTKPSSVCISVLTGRKKYLRFTGISSKRNGSSAMVEMGRVYIIERGGNVKLKMGFCKRRKLVKIMMMLVCLKV